MNDQQTGGVFYCPSCGTDMQMADGDTLQCVQCGRKDNICECKQDTVDFDFSAAEKSPDNWSHPVVMIRCEPCGGKAIRSASDISSGCVFCGSKKIGLANEPLGIQPGFIAPFKTDHTSAAGLLNKWINKRLLAPFSFHKEYHEEHLQGVYLPYWTFNAFAKATYTGQAGDYYYDTEVNTITTGERTETKKNRINKLRWRFVSGMFDRSFSDMIFSDSSHVDPKVIENVEPYRLSDMIKYDPRYIQGYAIECYSSGLQASWGRAVSYMSASMRQDIQAIIKRGADVMGTVLICTDYTGVQYRLMLLPLWISSYRFKNKVYNVFVNGQTGEVFGRYPISALKIAVFVLAALAVAAAMILIL